MGRGWFRLLWGLGCLALVDCNAFDAPPVPQPLPATGGQGPIASGGSGGSGGSPSTSLCPPHPDCCFTPTMHYCSGDRVCHSYAEIDCGRHDCGDPCPFGCEAGACVPDPTEQPGGGTSGGGAGPGGEGGMHGGAPP